MKTDQLCSAEIRSAFETALSTCQRPAKNFTLNLSTGVSNQQSLESS